MRSSTDTNTWVPQVLATKSVDDLIALAEQIPQEERPAFCSANEHREPDFRRSSYDRLKFNCVPNEEGVRTENGFRVHADVRTPLRESQSMLKN